MCSSVLVNTHISVACLAHCFSALRYLERVVYLFNFSGLTFSLTRASFTIFCLICHEKDGRFFMTLLPCKTPKIGCALGIFETAFPILCFTGLYVFDMYTTKHKKNRYLWLKNTKKIINYRISLEKYRTGKTQTYISKRHVKKKREINDKRTWHHVKCLRKFTSNGYMNCGLFWMAC